MFNYNKKFLEYTHKLKLETLKSLLHFVWVQYQRPFSQKHNYVENWSGKYIQLVLKFNICR